MARGAESLRSHAHSGGDTNLPASPRPASTSLTGHSPGFHGPHQPRPLVGACEGCLLEAPGLVPEASWGSLIDSVNDLTFRRPRGTPLSKRRRRAESACAPRHRARSRGRRPSSCRLSPSSSDAAPTSWWLCFTSRAGLPQWLAADTSAASDRWPALLGWRACSRIDFILR